MKIRDFKPEDLETLARFKEESVRISFPGSDYNIDGYRKRLLSSDPATIKVAEDRGRIAGYIWFSIRSSSRGQKGVINHTFVEQDYRRQGLSLKLNKAAEGWLRSQGIGRIEVKISKDNMPSLEMCRKLGYKETRLILEKSLFTRASASSKSLGKNKK